MPQIFIVRFMYCQVTGILQKVSTGWNWSLG